MSSLKLHLGCGSVHIDGFVNVDINYLPGVDIVDNVRHLRKFEAGSVDLIYASNVLEHLGRWEYTPALSRWYELLKPGGLLRIAIPDFEAICDYYMRTRDLDSIYSALYAGQDGPQNYHHWCWDFTRIKRDLETVGFKDPHKFDRNKTDYADSRDWSINFVPYRDENGNELPDEQWFQGTSIVLNVEATK